MSAPRDWTAEQLAAIERRQGEVLLDAGAGSGKTSVLVERYARAVLEDGVDVAGILAITFTEKAAAELRERIRTRLRELGAPEAARATESAFISTIHGFCARLLRAQALRAGIDPAFTVLDEPQARRLALRAFDDALGHLGELDGGVTLIAAYGADRLRGAVMGVHGELRSRGQSGPVLPALTGGPSIEHARDRARAAAAVLAAELGDIAEPGSRVLQALERLEAVPGICGAERPWPAEMGAIELPGNGSALATPACQEYKLAVAELRGACQHREAREVHRLLGALLEEFAQSYAARKRAVSGLDFEDLELAARDLLERDPELRGRYRARFAHVMVDELQDTNSVQLELIRHVSGPNLFMVGDAQQSIYAFRHAEVELFEELGERLQASGDRLSLRTNFRSRPEILEVVNKAFTAPDAMGEGFRGLRPGRSGVPGAGPLVELILADKGGEWEAEAEGISAPWRVAEARALATRVNGLIEAGARARDVVLLTRATTDLRAYESALELRGVPTYVIGGRGYWDHPQVIDMVAYLRALANPRQEQELYTVLVSPLVGASLDALVVIGAQAAAQGRDPWWLLSDPGDALAGLEPGDRERLEAFAGWFSRERRGVARHGVEELIERALGISGYDLAMLAMPGGRRRMANVRKLMRLAREHEESYGRDLRAFLELIRGRAGGGPGGEDARESEAPVEGEALDAVKLMTIHRAKGLEFPIVCVADTGRQPWNTSPVLRVGKDGRLGLALQAPGVGDREPALDYKVLGQEEVEAGRREERRLFYVALTRAQERLIVSGAIRLEAPEKEKAPSGWLSKALLAAGVAPVHVVPGDFEVAAVPVARAPAFDLSRSPLAPDETVLAGPRITRLSYSSLAEYERCGYRFYVERVLGIPGREDRGRRGEAGPRGAGSPDARERGILVHALLQDLDFRRPRVPTEAEIVALAEGQMDEAGARELRELTDAFTRSELCARLARCEEVRREQRFSFLLPGGMLVNGALDVLAREPGGETLVVDYKSDKLGGDDPTAIVTRAYTGQRLIYALAALRSGAREVEVLHVFLEAPDAPVQARFTADDAPRLEAELGALAGGIERDEFAVAPDPHRALCHGCPAEGGLCSWPLEKTRREAPVPGPSPAPDTDFTTQTLF